MKPNPMAALALGLTIAAARTGAQSSEARLGVGVLSTRQNVFAGHTFHRSSASLTAVELLVRGDAAGLYGRYITGTVGDQSFRGSDGRLRMAEVRAMLGPPVLSVEGGIGRRARSGGLSDEYDQIIQLGLRSSIMLGNSGFSVSTGIGAYGRSDSLPGQRDKKFGLVGWEAATGVFYQLPRGIPLYLNVGYRYERIRSEQDLTPLSKEELSSVHLAVGIRHLGRKRPTVPVTPATTTP